MNYKEAYDRKIFRCISGSHAYGFSTPESDQDIRGIFVASPVYLLGLDNVEQVTRPGHDEELHELRKYLHLASNCNPNILELLFVDPKHILYKNKVYDILRESRDLFLTKKARHTFAGYAVAQMHRIKNHRGYLLDPPTHKPTRKEFGLPEHSVVPKENRNALISLPDKFVKEEAKGTIVNEKKFHQALSKWNSYNSWKAKRNPARQELERKYLFDCKHGCHLVRLAYMGKEILRDGTLTVFRPERDELLAIRNGAWSYEQLEDFASKIDNEMAELEKNSKLPYSIDRKKLKDLTIELLTEAYGIDFKTLIGEEK